MKLMSGNVLAEFVFQRITLYNLSMSTETEIQSEVESLKARFSDTKQLYREVCALLFFRHDITPTTNKLYQYVRRGSMSAPADALAKFWDDLRSKARVEIDHPDLPSEIKESAASAIAAIWRQASAAAREELRVLRDEVSEQLVAAEDKLASAHRLVDEHQVAQEALQIRLDAAAASLEQAQAEVELERRGHVATSARMLELQRTCDDLRAQQQRLQEGFSADLAKAREAAEAAAARAEAAERRGMLEIDQERQARARAEKTLENVRTQAGQAEERLRSEAQTATEASARLAARADALEAANREMQARAEQAAGAESAVRAQLRSAEDELARAKTEADTLRGVLDRLSPPGAAAPARSTKSRKT